MKPSLRSLLSKPLLVLVFSISFSHISYSQAIEFGNEKIKWEAGLHFGPSFFLGDLGGKAGKGTNFLKDYNPQTMTLASGAFLTVYPVKWAGLRLQGNIMKLSGDDDLITTNGIDELWRKQRNLDFKTKVWEAQALLEFFPTMLFADEEEYEPRFRPYVTGGLGIFHYNPQGSLKDANGNKTWYYLKPLRTEGQGMAEYPNVKEYDLSQLHLAYGGGFKYYISDRVNYSMELLYRKTFTDYIDDVSQKYIDAGNYNKYMPAAQASIARQISDKTKPIIFPGMTRWPAGTQRGDLKDADAYFTVVARIGIRLGPIYSSSFNRNAVRQTKCPAVF